MSTLLPDYAGGSIANLMRTLADACGASAPLQTPLDPRYGTDAESLAAEDNILLLVVDGLGAKLLETKGVGTLRQQAGKRLTSVFPSTTATAIPTFMTGLMPAQHALTGWHMWLDELQAITSILPLTPRTGPPFEIPAEQLPARLFSHAPIYTQMRRPAWVVSPREIADSPFNAFHSRGATTLAYGGLEDLLLILPGLARQAGKKFIYAYWPTLDSTAHRFGIDSEQVEGVLEQFCIFFDTLLALLAGTRTTVLVTADHGFIDSPPDRVIDLAELPSLAAMLTRPLCGERRAAWCYLQPGVEAEFMAATRELLGNRAEAVPRQRLLQGGWFGSGTPHPQLASRIGDVALVMQDNWTIKDWLPGEKRYRMLGVHGGISADEMLVPLIAVEA